MPYRIQPNETPAEGIKRLSLEQLDRAGMSLDQPDDVDEAVHDARKRFKKIRAAVRLVRDEVGEDVYKHSNVTMRDAGRRFSALRDSQVLIETVADVGERYADVLYNSAFDEIEENLAERHDKRLAQIQKDGVSHEVVATLRRAASDIEAWPIETEGFAAFSGGLKRVYKRGRKAMGRAQSDPTDENLHEWRKRIKYLWYHMRILEVAWPDLLSALADAIHDLADLLGEDHDLALLRATLLDEPQLAPDKAARQALAGLVNQRRRDLQMQAWPLGKRIYAEKPSNFVARCGVYWASSENGSGMAHAPKG
jgi:CHAD domain-containing protein